MVTTASILSGVGEHVWRVEGDEVMLRVRGEVKGRTTTTRR